MTSRVVRTLQKQRGLAALAATLDVPHGLLAIGAALLTIAVVPTLAAQQNRPAPAPVSPTTTAHVDVVPVRENISVLGGAGANIVLSVGRDGVFMVDTGLDQNVDKVLTGIQQIQKQLEIRTPAAERFAAEGNFATVL